MNDQNIFAKKPEGSEAWDVAIIGSGPAGLTAAIYTTRGAASTIVLGGENWGGQLMLTTTVDNFPGFPDGIQGPDLMKNMRDQVERFGAVFVQKNASYVDFSKNPYTIRTSEAEYLAKSVIIATGASNKWLGVEGEQELLGRGVATCAPCDAPFYKNKKVAVVGGGDSAMTEALVLTKYADKVTLIHRRGEFRASAAMQKKVVENTKIEVLWNTEVTRIVGQNKVEKIALMNNKDNKQSDLEVDGVFIAVGHKPDSDLFKGPIEMDERGYVIVKDHTKTNLEGVFVAGEVHDQHYRQAITTAGFGCMAGMDALRYLDKNVPSW
ncbi:MAG: Thioredoxin reductase [Microgenomates group bacterium GW2011_GWC1_37_8]|uniref:Thioredoxin reductase n=1 Tax=Candidatus Woesebacteria bacterium GW2011_GWB1_38_8 TaxID=1618570 RepID=A0A0G0P6U4_9BACT|nr:MAG: Thioredoxin reductase [Microgenomates group bacterium GW2011_GWC1_37_8]KKQ85031.1 MAG: Thioredoxin reductase [Candidatus Woesebacteria bacterium GW2011_GWB1_38_8]